MAPTPGIEPGTYSLGNCRSIQLSYASETGRVAEVHPLRKSRKQREGAAGGPPADLGRRAREAEEGREGDRPEGLDWGAMLGAA